MTTKKPEKAEAAAQQEATRPQEVTKTKAEVKYVVEKLRSNCFDLFGVTSSTFDGAMYGYAADKEYSVNEVKRIIDVFLNGGK